MKPVLTGVTFAHPETAADALAAIQPLLPPNLWQKLPALLAQLPDPDSAVNYLEAYLSAETADGSPREIQSAVSFLEHNPPALHHLLTIFSYSRFLADMLVREPELILWIDRSTPARAAPLDRMKAPEDLHEEFARFAATSFDVPPALIIARFKRREYLRITLRDVLGVATLGETTLELSQLADVLLENALRISARKLESDFGVPQFTDRAGKVQQTRLAILALGKLGGEELNYSSDIDLMFVYGHDGATSGGKLGATTNSEFFVRLAQSIVKTLTEMTPDGVPYRVDLRLRAQGREGLLATSVETALDYYRSSAREWELQMLVKARTAAGDLDSGNEFIREVQPLVYRPEFNFAALGAVVSARALITRELQRESDSDGHAAEWNVKLTPGGIRDVEFLTQCLQRLYGGAEPWLRSGTTLVAMQRLHDKGRLSSRDFYRLSAAYQFLRRVEHRLQLRDGLQRHTLPESPDALERLARRCGVESVAGAGRTPGQQLLERLRQHFSEVREIYERLLAAEAQPETSPRAPAATESETGAGALLRRLRTEWPAVAEMYGTLTQSDPQVRRVMQNYLTSAAADSELMAELEANPSWLAPAADLLAASDFAAESLVREPRWIKLLVQPPQNNSKSDPSRVTSRAPAALANQSLRERMSELRRTYREQVFLATVDALLRGKQPFETFARFTELANHAIRETLEVAALEIESEIGAHLHARDLAHGPLAVIALGRLGSSEMDIGSDADVIFVTSEISAEDRDAWRRVIERFVHLASSQTREGILFPIDTRLRPRGSEGEICQTIPYVVDYFRTDAAAWEAASFLKARTIAGNFELGDQLLKVIHEICAERFWHAHRLREELAQTRERLVTEGSVWEAGRPPEREFKKLAGGFYDVDYIVAFLFLARGLAAGIPPGGNILRQIAALESAGETIAGLTSADANALRIPALLYRGTDHAIRLITGHSAQRDPEPALAARVEALLRRWSIPVGDLRHDLRETRERTRALYGKFWSANS
jgi:[glutamine synthetase] adenylyltransferase / [glutamine synthetase]-adenylyl-L-tyrosine phosphorylase